MLQIAVVARLLAPSDFGIFALGAAFMIGVTSLSALGIEKHLVQRPELPTDFVRSAWSANIIRSALIALLGYCSAGLYAEAIGESTVEPVLQLVALAPLLLSLASPNQYVAQRNLQVRSLATFQVLASVFQFMTFVILAYVLRNVFALAIGQLVVSAIKAFLSWFWFGTPGLPKIDRQHYIELLGVGKHYLVIAIGTFVMTQADNLIVGSLLGAVTLGYYALAYKASQFSIDLLNATVGRIVLPVFSRLQREPLRLASAFREIWRIQISVLIPLAAAIAILADHVIMVLFGEQYSDATELLRLLAILTLGRGISHLLGPFIIGTGGVRFASHIKTYEACLFVVAVWIATFYWGVAGAALSAGIVYALSAVVRLVYVMLRLSFSARWLFSSTVGTLTAAGVAAVLASLSPDPDVPAVALLLGALIFTITYIACSLLTQRDLLPLIQRNWISVRRHSG